MPSPSEILAQCSPWEGYTFDPSSHIRAVNTLCVLPEPEVHAHLQAFTKSIIQRNDLLVGSTKLQFLLRLLFIPLDETTYFPEVNMGKPLDVVRPVADHFPIYPLVLHADVPLLIVSGFFLGGLPSDPTSHLEFCIDHCRLRSGPLRPPDNPMLLADELTNSPTWYRKDLVHDRGMLRAQLLRLVHSVFTVPGANEPTFFSKLTDERWQEYRTAFGALGATWNAKENDYVA